eukprot:Hpha_TRINITY_DN15659_c3_g2::TRINITY_DN15659_c3_g2_i2::g.101365::m.101365
MRLSLFNMTILLPAFFIQGVRFRTVYLSGPEACERKCVLLSRGRREVTIVDPTLVLIARGVVVHPCGARALASGATGVLDRPLPVLDRLLRRAVEKDVNEVGEEGHSQAHEPARLDPPIERDGQVRPVGGEFKSPRCSILHQAVHPMRLRAQAEVHEEVRLEVDHKGDQHEYVDRRPRHETLADEECALVPRNSQGRHPKEEQCPACHERDYEASGDPNHTHHLHRSRRVRKGHVIADEREEGPLPLRRVTNNVVSHQLHRTAKLGAHHVARETPDQQPGYRQGTEEHEKTTEDVDFNTLSARELEEGGEDLGDDSTLEDVTAKRLLHVVLGTVLEPAGTGHTDSRALHTHTRHVAPRTPLRPGLRVHDGEVVHLAAQPDGSHHATLRHNHVVPHHQVDPLRNQHAPAPPAHQALGAALEESRHPQPRLGPRVGERYVGEDHNH